MLVQAKSFDLQNIFVFILFINKDYSRYCWKAALPTLLDNVVGDKSLMLCHHHQVPELGLRLELVSANTLSTVQVVSGFGIARESRISEPSVGSKHAGGAGLDLGWACGRVLVRRSTHLCMGL